MKLGRNIAITLICIILGAVLAWQYKSINYNQSALSFQNKRTEDLQDELIKLQKSNDDLSKRLQEVQDENKGYESAKAGDDIAAQNLLKELETARIFGGLIDVRGKGVIITLENGIDFNVRDDDILKVLNELRASDVQAMSVNEERIVAMTEVREAPPYIMINGRQMVPPFIIKAIGDPDKIQNSLNIINGVVEDLKAYINVSIKPSDNLSIAKVRDDGTVIKTDLLAPVK